MDYRRPFQKSLSVLSTSMSLVGLVFLAVSCANSGNDEQAKKPPEEQKPLNAKHRSSLYGAPTGRVFQSDPNEERPNLEKEPPDYNTVFNYVDSLNIVHGADLASFTTELIDSGVNFYDFKDIYDYLLTVKKQESLQSALKPGPALELAFRAAMSKISPRDFQMINKYLMGLKDQMSSEDNTVYYLFYGAEGPSKALEFVTEEYSTFLSYKDLVDYFKHLKGFNNRRAVFGKDIITATDYMILEDIPLQKFKKTFAAFDSCLAQDGNTHSFMAYQAAYLTMAVLKDDNFDVAEFKENYTDAVRETFPGYNGRSRSYRPEHSLRDRPRNRHHFEQKPFTLYAEDEGMRMYGQNAVQKAFEEMNVNVNVTIAIKRMPVTVQR